jgi:ribosome-associated translation inhibitor RaiA
MNIRIKQDKVEVERSLIANIHRHISADLKRFERIIKHVCVKIADINGPHGGEDKSCRIQVLLKRASSVIIEERGASLLAVAGRAIARMDMAMFRAVDRRRERRRIPVRVASYHSYTE